MSNPISEDCSSGLHGYCTPCECVCHISTNTEFTREECSHLLNILLDYVAKENHLLSTLLVVEQREITTQQLLTKAGEGALHGVHIRPVPNKMPPSRDIETDFD